MTTIAVEILAWTVIRMAEADAERACLCRGRRVASGGVTSAASGNINSAGLLAGSVTLITGLVRAESGGDSLGDAATRRSMTGGAALLCSRFRNASRVLRVVKLRIETSQAGKFFKRRILLIESFGLMADRAHRAVGRIELCLMAACTIFMLRESRLDRVIAARVANRATPAPAQGGVIARIRVREFGIVLWRGQKKRCFQRFRRLFDCRVVCNCDGASANEEYQQHTDEEEKQDDERERTMIAHAASACNVRRSMFCFCVLLNRHGGHCAPNTR